LYFAENPSVATQYRDALSAGELRLGDGTPYDPKNIKHFAAATMLDYKTPADAIKDINNQIKELGQINASWRTQAIADKKALISEIQKGGLPKLEEISHGSLYKVDLPDEAIAKMLDWDKPLSQQAPEVRKAMQDIGMPLDRTGQGAWQGLNFEMGRQAGDIGGRVVPMNPVEASKKLQSLGVPGIRYLDGGSRNQQQRWVARHPKGGEDVFNSEAELMAYIKRNPEYAAVKPNLTNNYVVFPGNEGLLKILERQ
jgi:hypothetical protein